MSTEEATAPARPTVGSMFRPVNDKCHPCGKVVDIGARQQIAWDNNNQCRRQCEKCMNAAKTKTQ